METKPSKITIETLRIIDSVLIKHGVKLPGDVDVAGEIAKEVQGHLMTELGDPVLVEYFGNLMANDGRLLEEAVVLDFGDWLERTYVEAQELAPLKEVVERYFEERDAGKRSDKNIK